MILLGEGVAAQAKRRLLERAGARVVGETNEKARLAIVAIADDDAARAAIARLKARGILVNAVDRSAHCDFTLPAIVDRDPLILAIGTGGASAGLAKAVRQRIEALLPATLGTLVAALGAGRGAINARWPDPADRRRAIDAALANGGVLDPLAEHRPDAVEAWLANSAPVETRRRVEITLASPDPDDLTLRTARLLGQADRVVHDGAVPETILSRARADAERIVGLAPADAPGLTLILKAGWR